MKRIFDRMMSKKLGKAVAPAVVVAAVAILATHANAGTGGMEFNDALTMITDWTQGGLGKLLAASAFLIGIVMGIVRQSLMAAAIGIGFALAVNTTPTIINSVITGLL
jgi:conjugal transfer pilus assembly protein TraA